MKILVVWVGLVFVFFEVGIRVWCAVGDEVAPSADASTKNEWEWAERHLEAGQARFGSTLAYDPALGWRNARDLRLPDLTTNSDGWRATREFLPDKPPDTRRLVLVGDSYTFGFGVRDDEAFAALVQQGLGAGWEVMNFAVPGYGTDQQVLSYETIARRYQPDVVVLGFFLRDYSRNLLRFRTYAKPRFELDGEGLRLVGSPVIEPGELYSLYAEGERVVGGGVIRSWFAASFHYSWRKLRDRDIHVGAEGWRIVARLQQRFRDAVLADNALPLWLQIPTEEVVRGEKSSYTPLSELSAAHTDELGLDCIQLAPLFREHDRAHPEDSFHRPPEEGGHLSLTGNRIVADALVAWIEQRLPGSVDAATPIDAGH